jgi:hypothetical protein
MRKSTKAKAQPEEDLTLDDLELELDELDDVDLDDEPTPEVKKPAPKKAPAKKAAKPVPAVEFSEPEEDEVELDFEEEEPVVAAPQPKVTTPKKTAPKTATRKTARDVAQEEENDMVDYLRGYAAGKFGVDLSREDAERVQRTLEAAEQDYTPTLFAHLIGSSTTETASATVIKSPGVTQVVPKAPRATKTQTRAAAATAPKVAPKKAAKASSGDLDMKAVRAWAQSNGYELGDRGRIPADIQDAYRAAN